LRLVFL